MNTREFFRCGSTVAATPLAPVTVIPSAGFRRVDLGLRIYRTASSEIWQCRFQLEDGSWHRLSTGSRDLTEATHVANALAQRYRSREAAGLPAKQISFGSVVRQLITELTAELERGQGRPVYRDYIAVYQRYLLPFFGHSRFEDMTPQAIMEFDEWRRAQIGRQPKASTLRTHASAFNRVIAAARARALLPNDRSAPELPIRGQRSQPRPGFTEIEIQHLLNFLPEWSRGGRLAVEREIRPLLRDYVEFLLYTGVRHGTEARGLRWRHLQWHLDAEERYLRIWVSGKTGPRNLIAKAGAVTALERLASRNLGLTLDETIQKQISGLVFVASNGYNPHGFEGSFRKLMRDSALLKDSADKNRTLYSLRHTYATFALKDGISIHTIARQMGTSVLMLERHYSKLTPLMNAAELGR